MTFKNAGCLAGIATLIVLAYTPVHAQQGSEISAAARHRNECRLAAQVLRSGEPHTKRSWAIGYIASCAEEGAEVLAEQWRSAVLNQQDLERVTRGSMRLRDARLYNGLRMAAADRSRPAAVRVAAMLVLAKYVDPGSALWLTDLVPPDSIGHIRLRTASTTASLQLVGAQPLTAPVAGEVLALFERLAAARSTEPREVWYAAAVLARRVRSDIELGRAQ